MVAPALSRPLGSGSSNGFPEVLVALVENLTGESADCGVFNLGQIGERNPGRGIDDLKAVTGQQDDSGFGGEAKQETDAEVAFDEPGLELGPVKRPANFLQVDQRVIIDIARLTRCRNTHVPIEGLVPVADQLLG